MTAEVELDDADDLPRACPANFDNVFALHRTRFKSRVTRLDQARLADVCQAYQFAAGCGPN